jgi:hypothetical protein
MPDRATVRLVAALALAAAGAGAQTTAPVRYTPPEVGLPKTRVAAASREATTCATRVEVLAPEHTGLTRSPAPDLWWFLEADCGFPVEITLLDAARFTEPPLLERRLAPPEAGFHALRLGRAGVSLEPGRDYSLNVAVVVDPANRSSDVFASAGVRLATAGPPPDGADVAALAAAGLWYDALAAAMGDPTARAALLDQVGLQGPAASSLPVVAP